MRGEDLHKTIMKVWNNEDNLCTMSRAFIHHTQVVNSILHYEGGNDYLYKKKGLHFGIRKTFINDEDGQGVLMVQIAPEADHETHIGQVMNDRAKYGLRFAVPDVRPLFENSKLSP